MTTVTKATGAQSEARTAQTGRPQYVTVKVQVLDSPRDLDTVGLTLDTVLGDTHVDKSRQELIEGVIAYHHSEPEDPEQPDGTHVDVSTIFFVTGSGVRDLIRYLRNYGGEFGNHLATLIQTLKERALVSAGTAITLIEDTIKIPVPSRAISALGGYFNMTNGVVASE